MKHTRLCVYEGKDKQMYKIFIGSEGIMNSKIESTAIIINWHPLIKEFFNKCVSLLPKKSCVEEFETTTMLNDKDGMGGRSSTRLSLKFTKFEFTLRFFLFFGFSLSARLYSLLLILLFFWGR